MSGKTLFFAKGDIHVMLAMPVYRDIPVQTVIPLLETQHALIKEGIENTIQIDQGCSLVHHARTKAVWDFLKTDATHLFFIDSDIVWKAKDFIRLLMFATKMECVCGLYPAKRDPPTLYLNINDPDSEVETNEYGCIPFNGTGLGFTVVQRRVIEAIVADAPLVRFPLAPDPIPYVFRCGISEDAAQGEDMAFFADVRAKGFGVWADPAVKLGHIGTKEYRLDPDAFKIRS